MQFSVPIITKWEFKKNDNKQDIEIDDNYGIPIYYGLNIKKIRENEIESSLTIKIGNEDDDIFVLNAEISTRLTMLNYDINNSEKNDNILKLTSANLLFSYLRPIISQFTSYAGFSSFVLPFINASDIKEVKIN